MYGTVARIRVKPGHLEQLQEWNRRWETERQVDGFVKSYVYQLDADPNSLMLVVLFRDKASYFANAQDPRQDAWYQEMVQHLEGSPEWHDGEVVYESGGR